ncbi:MCD1 [[Candida] subhashii]|uniref:MCD1 n=1 Tax=[Candida] subhashii TaxID=561895 RepID=A0A8J5QIM1_9ASCO|nr:MCD1 [[Candida] subhashii]KAG7663702.1 MCD1 [[Candida] subhashii]
MLTDTIMSKQGPLGHVWLAANYDKKLTKQQLMSTSIAKSTEYLSNHPITYSSQQSQQSQQTNEPITLRLSGQLLLGIVRIYSRKTKYLLEDVNDILYKLKSSFKLSSGARLGSDGITNQINLPPQQTVITNLNTITLADQVTKFDLLYQDDLNLDDVDEPGSNDIGGFFSQRTQQQRDEDDTFDQSIEFPRYEDAATPGAGNDEDMDLELDFDLDLSDDSIEVGRNASQIHDNDREVSIFSNIGKDTDIFDFDFGQPLETVDDMDNELDFGDNSDGPEEPLTPTEVPQPQPQPKRVRKRRTGITEQGEIITNKRKLIVDSPEDLEGISIETLKRNQELLLNADSQPKYISLNLSLNEKLKLIQELATPNNSSSKRRKLWDIDLELQTRCLELSEREETRLQEQHDLQFSHDYEDEMDFDLSLPDFNDEEEQENHALDAVIEEEEEQQDDSYTVDNIAKATIQVADELRDLFKTNDTVDLQTLMDEDLRINDKDFEKQPLGLVNKRDGARINKRREATKCFFELLVLATNDCIQIEQNPHQTDIVNDITIRSRDRLFSNFL